MEFALLATAVRPGGHEVDYAMSFLDGNARLWLLSCLERGHNFPDLVSLKSALAETFGPVEAEEEFRLALYSLCQTDSMSLEEYVSEFTRLSLGIPDLDEPSRALLFTRGLSSHLNSEVMREHPRTLSDAIRAARVALYYRDPQPSTIPILSHDQNQRPCFLTQTRQHVFSAGNQCEW